MSSNPNKIISLQELINAQVDAYKLELIMNEAPWVEVTTRLGRKCYSIATIQGIIDQYKKLVDQELDNLREAIEIAAAAGAGAAGWIDKLVLTWSGRTQEAKNKENPSPFDFKATGDGVTNDTQAFIDIEENYKDQIIDLLGKTYKVDRDFTKNKYINGSLRIINSNTGRGVVKASPSKYQKSIGNGQKAGEVICPLTNDIVSTGSTIVQSAYYLQVENRLYTQRSILETDTDEICIIEAFDYASISISAPPIFTSKPLNFIGHQSIAVQRTSATKFWATSSKTTKGSEKARFIVRFELNNATGEALNIEYFKVFSDEFASSLGGANVMSVSPNGQFLVVTGNHSTKGRYVRVFKTDVFLTEGDYSDKYIYEFGFQFFNGFNPQSICCDNEFIYILHGGTTGTEKVEIYTLDGAFVDLDDKFTVGSYDATLLPYYYYEPESLFIGDAGRLLCLIAAGKKAGKDARGSYTNIINDVLFTPTRNRKTDGDRPLYFLDASKTIAHSPSRALSYWTVAATGIYSVYKTQNKNATVYSTTSNESFSHRLNCNGTGQPQYRVTNDIGDGMLQISSNGGFGLYDIKYSKWLINANSNTSNIQYPLNISGNTSPSNDNYFSLGTASMRWVSLYAATGTIQTSDERYKQQFRSLHEAEKNAALEIKNSICLYKFNDAVDLKGDDARWHCGVKAQEVVSIMQQHGLKPFDYAFVCFDEWDEQEEIIETWVDEFGEEGDLIREAGFNIIQEYRAAGSRYAIRYDELSMFILSAI
jgi:hypothetical protein